MSKKTNETEVNKTITPSLTEGFRDRPVVVGVRHSWIWVLGVLVIVLVIVMGAFFYKSQRTINKLQKDLQEQQKDPSARIEAETHSLVEEVGKLIILPNDEDPTIATVADLDKLKGQQFFANAQLGDKVLIYPKAQKAILYRPSEKKIIELAPLNTGANTVITNTSTNINK